MSLFLGKDNSNNPIMHISSGTSTIDTLKGPPMTNTTFHSDITYLSYKVFTPISSYFIPNTSASSTTYYTGGLAIEMSNEFYAMFSVYPNRLYIILLDDSDNGLNNASLPWAGRTALDYPAQCSWFSTPPVASTNDGRYEGETQNPSYTNRYGYINTQLNTSNIKLIVTNYSWEGTLFNYKTSNAISVSASGLIIGGIDITNYPYISRHIINSVDSSINLNGDMFQLVNTNSSGNFSISSSPNITLSINNKVIATSLVSNNLCLKSLQPSTVYYDLDVGTTKAIVSGFNLSTKSIVVLSFTTALVLSTGVRIYSNYLLSYSEGKVKSIRLTSTASVDIVCSSGNVYLRFNSFWTSHYSNYIGIRYMVFN